MSLAVHVLRAIIHKATYFNRKIFLIKPPFLATLNHTLHLPQSVGAAMANFIEPLVVGRVIGEVVDLFVPKNTMSVYYGPKHVTNGCDVKPSMSVDPPNIQIAGLRPDLYTLVYMIFTVNFFFLACMLDIY